MPMTPDRARSLAMMALRLAVGAIFLNHSLAMVFIGASGGAEDHIAGFHLMMAGLFETLAALLFMVPRTTKTGAILLGFVIVVATVIHRFQLEESLDMLVYLTAIIVVALDDRARRAASTV